MFICDVCKGVSKPHEPSVKIVTKTREKEYFFTDKEGNVFPVKPSYKKKKTGTIAKGVEVVEEKSVCQRCANEIER